MLATLTDPRHAPVVAVVAFAFAFEVVTIFAARWVVS